MVWASPACGMVMVKIDVWSFLVVRYPFRRLLGLPAQGWSSSTGLVLLHRAGPPVQSSSSCTGLVLLHGTDLFAQDRAGPPARDRAGPPAQGWSLSFCAVTPSSYFWILLDLFCFVLRQDLDLWLWLAWNSHCVAQTGLRLRTVFLSRPLRCCVNRHEWLGFE